ncbi:MAG: UDP-N-acetylmuramoyl-L-alanyl-D-glutamate--2,6-diaminopimelate ligase [Acidobacteria bacterium]|nr:UDP-N-acetylmuramoyl-L-alanyl-D-glutamate--2,6-diaminopimelate ligase [Acidobacteriota bacterium]
MTAGSLVAGLPGLRLHGAADAPVTGIALDSRAVRPGDLFAALAGARADGRAFVPDALARGASAVLSAPPRPAAGGAAWIEADEPRAALASVAKRFHGAPDERLSVIGITGTNGKTTTALLLAGALGAAGRPCAVGGTLGLIGVDPAARATTSLTTPEAPALWAFLAAVARDGARAAALEVSSAALVAERVHGMRFAAAILTGIGHDHLDLHGTHEAYRAAKRRLFAQLPAGAVAVLPADDAYVREFAAAAGAARVVTFGDGTGDWQIRDHRPGPRGARFFLEGPGFAGEVALARPGPWDARNLAAAVATAVALGADPREAVRGACGVQVVPGRWEIVDAGQPFTAIVDFAHTPQALERVLGQLRRTTRGKVIAVFGCGGERDAAKRPQMGRIAGLLADIVIVTDDNPRGEDREAIAAAILEGLADGSAAAERCADRALAIRHAVALAGPGDAVLVAGKGHEAYQETAGRKVPFDDREVLRAAIRGRGDRA